MNTPAPFSLLSPKRVGAGLLLKGLAVGALALSLSGCLPIPVIEVSPSAPEAGESITFDGTGSIISNIPADTVAKSYRWRFGDGESGSGASTTHTYEKAGTYQVTLRVIDSAGRVGESTEPVTVTASTDTTDTSAESTDSTATSTTNTSTTTQ